MRATCCTTENQTGFNFPVANEEITFWSVTGQRMATYQMGPAGYNSSAFQASAVTYSGSNQIYVSNPGGTVAIGQIVSGQGIPAGTTVVGISGSSNSTITMSANATQSSYTSVPVTFTTPPPLVMTQTGTWYYFGGKLVKNKNGIVGTDRLGSIGKYYPYGQERPSATTNGTEKFTGYLRDAETGLDYAQHRYYQPGFGRFMTPDGYSSSSQTNNPASWNKYSYVLGDPVNGTDPDGRLTLLINGSFDSSPDWTDPNGGFGQAVASTFNTAADGPVEAWQWTDNDAVTIAQGYSGIFNGADALDAFINSYHFAPGEKLNIVAHSHGGNVVLLAAAGLHHKIDNLVTLGMPVNYDIPPYESRGNIKNYCAVSSYTDWTQWAGSSPLQIYQTAAWTYAAGRDEQAAIDAIINGDWIDYFFYQGQAAGPSGLRCLRSQPVVFINEDRRRSE